MRRMDSSTTYYDYLMVSGRRLKIRSMVGLLPICASTILEPDQVKLPRLAELVRLFRERYPEVLAQISPTADGHAGHFGRRLLSPLSKDRLEKVWATFSMRRNSSVPWNPITLALPRGPPIRFRFLRPTLRCILFAGGIRHGMFGGNSNWRGPIWMPVNALIVRGLLNLYGFYGDEFTVECPTGSGNRMTLFGVATNSRDDFPVFS
jgi:hypothetical protein